MASEQILVGFDENLVRRETAPPPSTFDRISVDSLLADGALTSQKIANLEANKITVIGGKLSDGAISSADAWNAKVNAGDLGDMAFEDLVQLAKLGTTIVEGGYLKTILINADYITAGTIIGRTFKTAEPSSSTAEGVVIEGGSSKYIKFYYDTTLVGYISGKHHSSGEDEYVILRAESGRYLSLRESQVAVNGNFVPSQDNNFKCGTSGQRWSEGRFEDIVVDDLTVNTGCSGCGYRELNLLQINQKKSILEKNTDVTPEELDDFISKNPDKKEDAGRILHKQKKEIEKARKITRFSLGDVLVWGSGGLEECRDRASTLVVGVSDKRGVPIVLGAEPIKVFGKVKRGDILVTSSHKGCAETGNDVSLRGTAIAIALESSDGNGENLILGMINKF